MSTPLRISASRVPMMLGESRWGTPLKLYHELRGELPKDEGGDESRQERELFEEGREYEPVILRQGARRYKMRSVEGPRELIAGDLIGHPDGYLLDEHGKLAVGEAKNLLFANVGEEAGWGEADTDRVPMAYWFQCQTYGHLLLKVAAEVKAKGNHLAIADDRRAVELNTADVAGTVYRLAEVSDTVYLFARLWHGVRRYKIKVDPVVCARIELEASHFLDRVARGEPPDPTGASEFRTRWAPVPKSEIEFTVREWEILKARHEAKLRIKADEALVEQYDVQLLGYMQTAAVAKWQGKKVLGASADRRFDVEAFRVAHPELYATYLSKLDKEQLGKDHADIYERFLVHPPAEEQTRKLRPAKNLGDLLK